MTSKWRYEGYLKTLSRTTIPLRYIFFDTETLFLSDDTPKIELPLRLGIAIYIELNKDLTIKKREVHTYYTSEEFINILLKYERSKKTLWVYAHNIKFDIAVLNLPYLFDKLSYKNDVPIINGMMFMWKVKLTKGSLMFLDTSNYSTYSLKVIGDSIGIEKMDVDFNNVSDDHLIEYCIRDCEIIEGFILGFIRFVKTHELGQVKYTIASQAFTAYRKRFMNNPPYIHNHEEGLELERNAFYGGRTECFKIGSFNSSNYYYLDVNSMYPYMMLNDSLPVEFVGYHVYYIKTAFEFYLKNAYIIADVTVNTNEALFAVRYKGKLIFPVGRIRTYVHHAELQYAYEKGMIEQVHSYSVYKKGQLFQEYVNFFYDLRKEYKKQDNKIYSFITKILMVSLYGKFAQLFRDTELIGEASDDYSGEITRYNPETNEHYQEVNWFGKSYYIITSGESTYSCPAIAGAITSLARFELYKYHKISGKDNIYYSDTDSIIVNEIGYDKLKPYIDQTQLGSLALEKTSDKITIFGNKDYKFGQDVRKKGVPSSAIEIGNGIWVYTQFEGFKTYMKRGATGAPKIWPQVKIRRKQYDKGIILDNGDIEAYHWNLNEPTTGYVSHLQYDSFLHDEFVVVFLALVTPHEALDLLSQYVQVSQ